jgi:hypothetical protein
MKIADWVPFSGPFPWRAHANHDRLQGLRQDSKPKRLAQIFCSKRCRDADAQRRKRANKSADTQNTPIRIPRSADIAPSVAATAAVGARNSTQSFPPDNLLLEGSYRSLEAEASIKVDANGFPELPAFLDRRRQPLKAAQHDRLR